MPKFKKAQRERLMDLVVDTLVFDFSIKESMAYIASRAPELAMINERTLEDYRRRARADERYDQWLNEFIKKEYVRMYKDRIDELLAVQKKNLRLYAEECSLPTTEAEQQSLKAKTGKDAPLQDKHLIVQYTHAINATNKRLTQLQNSGPTVAKLKALFRMLSKATTPEEKRKIAQQVLGEIENA